MQYWKLFRQWDIFICMRYFVILIMKKYPIIYNNIKHCIFHFHKYTSFCILLININIQHYVWMSLNEVATSRDFEVVDLALDGWRQVGLLESVVARPPLPGPPLPAALLSDSESLTKARVYLIAASFNVVDARWGLKSVKLVCLPPNASH